LNWNDEYGERREAFYRSVRRRLVKLAPAKIATLPLFASPHGIWRACAQPNRGLAVVSSHKKISLRGRRVRVCDLPNRCRHDLREVVQLSLPSLRTSILFAAHWYSCLREPIRSRVRILWSLGKRRSTAIAGLRFKMTGTSDIDRILWARAKLSGSDYDGALPRDTD
jgi:hypothetical protein